VTITYTAEECERVAKILLEDRHEHVKGACIRAGIPHKYAAIKRARSRFERGEDISEELAKLIAPIVSAVAEQCRVISTDAEELSKNGKFTNWQQWHLEKKDPLEYGRLQKTEVTGADGGPVQVSRVKDMDDDALIATMLDTSKPEGDEG
jgi:hypothetical protein